MTETESTIYELIGGPLCGLKLQLNKPELRIKLRAGKGVLVARYRLIGSAYHHHMTSEWKAILIDKDCEVRTAEYVATETPPPWEDEENKLKPWNKQWYLWQLKK